MYRILGNFFLDIIETVVVALSIFLIVYLFVMQPHQVNGLSMYPNFDHGEYLLTDKVSYRVGDPKRGDVVVFKAPEASHCPEGTGCDFIKRVIGLPGDTVEIREQKVYVNGQILDESYLPADFVTHPGAYTMNGPVVIPPGQYMVFGDNRNNSSDSRAWGPVTKEKIVGRVFFAYWPVSKIGLLPKIEY